MTLPYIEKYRPRVLSDVIGNAPIISRLYFFAKNGNLPNILLTSPPGQGKTTIAHCLGREMLGDQYKLAFLELNASDYRNVSDVREKVKGFAERYISLPANFYKLVFLDECDAMTAQAQLSLRRIIEDFCKTTRFVLACNEIQKVSEALQSRCCVLALQPVRMDEIAGKLQAICAAENIQIEPLAAMELARQTDGDIRSAVNYLESAAVLSGGRIELANLNKLLDVLDEGVGIDILGKARTQLGAAIERVGELLRDGFTPDEVMNALHRACISSTWDVGDLMRARALKAISCASARVINGAYTQLQIARALAEVSLIK